MSVNPSFGDSENHRPPSQLVEMEAKTDFEHALRKGFWRSAISWLTRSQNDLLPFDEIRKNLPMRGQHDIGMRQILLDKIVGSVGRYQDFDRAFLPRRSNTRSRWESIDKAYLQDISLPPIEVYKVGSVYFVKDGNHRVSVARERGQAYIDAYVIEIEVPFEIDENTNVDELIQKCEEIEFQEKTQIGQCCPVARIHFTVPGGYTKILEHIEVHCWYMGEKRKSAVAYEEAVADWYAEVYLPLARVIRRYDILENFPGRSEADLYLWIIEHLYYLREEYQAEVSLEEAATHFAVEYSKKPFSWFVNFIRRIGRMIDNE